MRAYRVRADRGGRLRADAQRRQVQRLADEALKTSQQTTAAQEQLLDEFRARAEAAERQVAEQYYEMLLKEDESARTLALTEKMAAIAKEWAGRAQAASDFPKALQSARYLMTVLAENLAWLKELTGARLSENQRSGASR